MPIRSILTLALTLALSAGAGFRAVAGETDGKVFAPLTPLDDSWRFSLAVPGWVPRIVGDVGVGGSVSSVDVSSEKILRSIDMVASLRGEVRKGRFGAQADFIYASLSDGIGGSGLVRKLDLRVDEIYADFGVSYRLIEGKRGWVDARVGFRYINIYQRDTLHPDAANIQTASTQLVDAVGDQLRTTLSESGLRDVIAQRIGGRLAALNGRSPTLPIAPLGGRERTPILDRIQQIIDARKAELAAALREQAQATTAALRARAQARVDGIKRDVSRKIASTLESKLNARYARTDDWFDPYVGLHARYNFNEKFYFLAKADIGGFGVGSELTWQASGAIGCQLTPNIFAEAGYRSYNVDYQRDGLLLDVSESGPEITLGVNF